MCAKANKLVWRPHPFLWLMLFFLLLLLIGAVVLVAGLLTGAPPYPQAVLL